jgi:hypothetical protein
MFRDAAHKGECIERSGDDDLLALFEAKAHAHRYLRQAVEQLGMGHDIGHVASLFVHDLISRNAI